MTVWVREACGFHAHFGETKCITSVARSERGRAGRRSVLDSKDRVGHLLACHNVAKGSVRPSNSVSNGYGAAQDVNAIVAALRDLPAQIGDAVVMLFRAQISRRSRHIQPSVACAQVHPSFIRVNLDLLPLGSCRNAL